MKIITLYILVCIAAFTAGWITPQTKEDWRKITNPILHPGYSGCHKCHRTWDVLPQELKHVTYYDTGRGCFPLCETCWHDLRTTEARLPFYRELFDKWHDEETTWIQIVVALIKEEDASHE